MLQPIISPINLLMLVRHRRGSLSYDTDSNHMRASRFLTGVDGISEIKFKICSTGVK